MMPGETVFSGAAPSCPCGSKLVWEVTRTGGGWAVWTFCKDKPSIECHGPYSRETGYFATETEADCALLRIQAGNYEDLRS